MNRLSPLITRSVGRHARPTAIAIPAEPAAESSAWMDDLRLFATGWFGGLVFFGTLLS